MTEPRHLRVSRTARYFTRGPAVAPQEVWFLLHGYGQLAARFLGSFAALDDGTRLLVAPEALSRFYLDTGTGGSHAQTVGASWMTREDREHDIADYIGYLDALADAVLPPPAAVRPLVKLLGFSQGAATAGRWAARARRPVDELILWGALLPPDLLLAGSAPFQGARLTLVTGAEDTYLPAAGVEAELARLGAVGIAARVIRFPGGHQIDPGVFPQLRG